MRLKRTIVAGMHELGLFGLSRRLCASQFFGATALVYHRVLPADAARDHYAALMGEPTTTQLEALILYLKRSFRFATPGECAERWRRGEDVDPFTLLLTFDDGYLDLHDRLLPILAACAVPATVFLTTGAISGRATWFQKLFATVERTDRASLPAFDDLPPLPLGTSTARAAAMEAVSAVQRRHPAAVWTEMIDRLCDGLQWDGDLATQRMMDWSHVEALHRSGSVSIGCHTVTHPNLDCCDARRARAEVFDCAEELRHRLPGLASMPFSYPHGRCENAEVRGYVRDAGFDCAFTGRATVNDRHADLYQLGRQHVPPNDLARTSMMLSGLRRVGQRSSSRGIA